MQLFARLITSMLGVGYFPIAPATAASALLAILVYFLGEPSAMVYQVGLPVLFLIGTYLSGVAEREWGKDARKIVIDEVLGFFVAIAFLSTGGDAGGLALAFFLFRFYDIVKPFPVGMSQRLPGGWGIMTDDLLAGIYANLTFRLLRWLFFPG